MLNEGGSFSKQIFRPSKLLKLLCNDFFYPEASSLTSLDTIGEPIKKVHAKVTYFTCFVLYACLKWLVNVDDELFHANSQASCQEQKCGRAHAKMSE